MLENLDQMAFARTEEATDPDARLLALVQMAEVRGQDAIKPNTVQLAQLKKEPPAMMG
jgi:hypothetical protein